MDIATLSTLFASTYSPDPNVQKAGELEIRKISDQEGLLPALMQIIATESIDAGVRQACTVFFKNRIQKYYVDPARARPDRPVVAMSDRAAIKANILRLLVIAPGRNTYVHVAASLRAIVANDFPEQWPGLIDEILQLLHSSEPREVTAGCIGLLEVVKSFRYRQGQTVLPDVITKTFPTLVEIAHKLLSEPMAPLTPQSPEVPFLLHIILKTYKSTLVLNLSQHQQSPQSIVPWGRLLFAVVNLQIPPELVPQDEEERGRSEWWKAKKWAYGTLDRLFHRFGNPSQLPSTLKKDYIAFAEHFVSSFAPEIIKTYLHQVELYISGQVWLSRKCQYLIFQFFTECVKPKSTWQLLKPHFQSLVSSFVFPQLSFSPNKQELWATDPVEYIRTSIDEYEDYNSPVSSATSFLVALASSRLKTTFLPILNFINSVLDGNPTPVQKFGAINMTSALAPFIMRHPTVRPAMEQFLVRHVLPDLTSPEPFLRAMACEVTSTLEKFDLQWTSPENLLVHYRGILRALDDPELPVRVHAALALNEMVKQHTEVAATTSPLVGKVIQDLLALADETDLDLLNTAMETMVDYFREELTPVAPQLTARLCESYLRLLREANAQIVDESEMSVKVDLDVTDQDDDKTFAAMGVAKTIGTIVSSLDSSPEILAQMQQTIIPIIRYTLETKAIDLFDNVYDLVDSLTFNLRSIAPEMWTIFDLTYTLFKSDAVDFLDEMLPSLDNFLSFGKDMFIARPDYVAKILDIYVTTMTNDQLGENDRCNGCKLIEALMLNLRGHVDDTIPTIIDTSLKILDPPAETRSLRLANLEVLINTILYNPVAALHTINARSQSLLKLFFDKWFDAVKSDKGFPRVHDKKLSILAMCGLLDLEPSQVPPSLQQGWPFLVTGILTSFKTLPDAVAARRELAEALQEGDEEDKFQFENEKLDLAQHDEDDQDVWDEDSQYIEYLAQEGARLRATQEKPQPEDAGEESDSDSDESIDEEIGYLSPLESVDPYLTFKHALTSFQMKNPSAYQASTTSLSPDFHVLLMEVMSKAEQIEAGTTQ
ncbi:ARM repeat-containing protein [Sistotremastrum niveocremeum HHB9708]|uniref:ARM repeat-containing protein n=1 Tax=Sistotremastrum niveocremeum HHB9708 TaxID=1314777 RepID=A0A164TEE7_9AGAM|nr:ARM repeat-containing protein [Sistotremastrum niveocremeum HHB9708]